MKKFNIKTFATSELKVRNDVKSALIESELLQESDDEYSFCLALYNNLDVALDLYSKILPEQDATKIAAFLDFMNDIFETVSEEDIDQKDIIAEIKNFVQSCKTLATSNTDLIEFTKLLEDASRIEQVSSIEHEWIKLDALQEYISGNAADYDIWTDYA
jgi:hypothetical protein